MSTSKADKLVQALAENEEEIKSGLRITGQAIKAAYDVHQTVNQHEQQVASEISQNESQAETDTARVAKEVHKEEEDIDKAEYALKKGLDSLGKLVELIKNYEGSLDADINELEDIARTLRNNPSNLAQSDIRTIVDIAGEAYSMVETEISVEEKVANYFVQYATDLEEIVEEEEMVHRDVANLEKETQAEAQRTGHKKRIKKLMSYESSEEQEFKQEVQRLKKEYQEEEQEIHVLQNEIIHTKEEIDALINTLSTIESYLQDLGYEKAASRLYNILQSVRNDYDKLQQVETELNQAENKMKEGESEAANI